jgi:hypothetical protein
MEARDAFQAGMGALPVKSLNLRTIDRFSVPRERFRARDYLQVGGLLIPKWYQDSRESLDIDLGKGFLQHDSRNRNVIVRIRSFSDPATVEILAAFHDEVSNRDLTRLLEALHTESNDTFEALVTDRTRSEIMGGPKP